MRSISGARYAATFGMLLGLTLGACAAPAAGGSRSTSVGNSPAAGSTSVGSPAPAVVASVTGSNHVVPTAPGLTASPVTSGAGVVATPLPDCKPAVLHSLRPGKLSFTTSEKAVAPWFVGDNPAAGTGYESAVAAAVATELGYPAGDVLWTRSDLTKVVAGQGSGFDVAVGEFATPQQTGGSVDYSTGYFAISQSVVARTGAPAAAVNRLAGLKALRLGSVSGTAGLPSGGGLAAARTPTAYRTAAAGLAALRSGVVDAVVLPTPVALAAGSSVTIIGQLNDPTEQPPQFGMILPRHSPLTACVSAAIDQLRITGTLATLLKTWVPSAAKPLS